MASAKYGRLFTEADVEKLLTAVTSSEAEHLRDLPGVSVDAVIDEAEDQGLGEMTFPADEPLFVLRGQDRFADDGIAHYATAVEWGGHSSEEYIASVGECADAMSRWQHEQVMAHHEAMRAAHGRGESHPLRFTGVKDPD